MIRLRRDLDVRVLVEDAGNPRTGWGILERSGAATIGMRNSDIIALSHAAPTVSARPRDIFITFNWWTTLNMLPVVRGQARHHKVPKIPLLYLIQDHEPGFYPFSTAHMLAKQALRPDWPLIGVYNSHELYEYCVRHGNAITPAVVFEPTMPPTLRAYLDANDYAQKVKRVVIYGRPSVARNCHSAILGALHLWSEQYPEFRDWDVVSAGARHRPIKLADGREVASLGKLPLQDYALLLVTSSVGLSLMASPHPSYPPLEMAHFGMKVVTNTYENKDLGDSHDNIISVEDLEPATIAKALAAACRGYVPTVRTTTGTQRPSYLDEEPFACAAEIADLLDPFMGGQSNHDEAPTTGLT